MQSVVLRDDAPKRTTSYFVEGTNDVVMVVPFFNDKIGMSTNQSANKQTNQPTDKPTNRQNNQPSVKPINRRINQPTDRSTD